MDKIDELIESEGDMFIGCDNSRIIRKIGEYYTVAVNRSASAERICTVGEYKERVNQKIKDKAYAEFSKEFDQLIVKSEQREELIKLIESACTNDSASIANVIIRSGWSKINNSID